MMTTTNRRGESRGGGGDTKDLGTSSSTRTSSARGGRGVGCNPRGNSSNGSRSRSAGRGRGRFATENITPVRRHRKRPEWDDSLGDPSQYKLTPEEAAQRKRSLVSKHNTLVFGLGGGTGSGGGDGGRGRRGVFAATAPVPKEATIEAVVVRARSASEQRAEQTRKTYGGGDGSGGQRRVRRSRSSSGVSSARRRENGKTENATTALPVGDVTVTAENDAKVGGVNDVTTASDNAEYGGPPPPPATGRPWVTADGSKACEEEGEGKMLAGGDALGLAGIQVGIKAFSERVWRLETYRRAGVEEGDGKDGDVGGREQRLRKGVDQEGTGADVGEAYGEGGDGEKEDIVSGASICDDGVVGRSVFNDSDHHHYAADYLQQRSPPSQKALSNQRDNNHGEVLVGQKLRTRQRKSDDDDDDDDAGHLSARDNKEAVELVERIQLLEAQVLQLRHYDAPVAPAAALADFGEDTKGGVGAAGGAGAREGEEEEEEGQAVGAHGHTADARAGTARSAEDTMRVMVADLLSLTSHLLKRATAAEQRLRDVTTTDASLGGGGGGGGEDGANNNTYDDGVLSGGAGKHPDAEEEEDDDLSLVRGRARSIALAVGRVFSGKGKEEEEQEEVEDMLSTPVDVREYGGGGQNNYDGDDQQRINPVAEQQEDRCSISPSSPPSSAIACTQLPPWQGGGSQSQRRRRVSTPVQQLRTTTSSSPSSPTTKDCWSEALDAVSNLVASRPVYDDGTTTTTTTPAQASAASPLLPSLLPSLAPSPRGRPISKKVEGVGSILAATDMMPSSSIPTTSTTAAVYRGREYDNNGIATAAAPYPFRVFGSPTAAPPPPSGPLLRPPSPRVADLAPVASRRWGPRVPLAPLRTTAVMSRNGRPSTATTTTAAVKNTNNNDNVNRATVSSFSSSAGREGDGGDVLSVPAFLAPTPVKKPQHPFERRAPPPAMRSPRWLLRHQHRVVVDKGEGSSVVVCGGRGGGGDDGSKNISGAPSSAANSRVFTTTVVGTKNEELGGVHGGVGSNAVNSPPIGQWYTPSRW